MLIPLTAAVSPLLATIPLPAGFAAEFACLYKAADGWVKPRKLECLIIRAILPLPNFLRLELDLPLLLDLLENRLVPLGIAAPFFLPAKL